MSRKLLSEAGPAEGRSLYDPRTSALVHHVNQALRAHKMFQRDKDYIVRNGKVVIIDEFTGRMMEGPALFATGCIRRSRPRRRPDPARKRDLASITFQNYFRLYDKLAGMTGTALTEAEEFMSIYGLDVVECRPTCRSRGSTRTIRSTGPVREKTNAIIDLIEDGRKRGQPMLVGTTMASIEKSERCRPS
jgi:preprotein translocase subunit SecA